VVSIFLKNIVLSLKVMPSPKFMLSQKVVLTHKVVLSRRVTMVSHKVVLSRKVVLSCQALFRVPQVMSRRTSGGCGRRRNLGTTTEVQLLSFICSTGAKGSKPSLWNIQNLGAVPRYTYSSTCIISIH